MRLLPRLSPRYFPLPAFGPPTVLSPMAARPPPAWAIAPLGREAMTTRNATNADILPPRPARSALSTTADTKQ